MQRILTASVLLVLLWVVAKLAPYGVFVGVFSATIAVAGWEAFRLYEAKGTRPFVALGVLAVLALCWSYSGLEPGIAPGTVLFLLVLLAFLAGMARRSTAAAMLESASATVLPAAFVGLGLGHLLALRGLPGEDGPDLLFLLFVCVIASDTAAYYGGRLFGRRALAPTISPKKTREGAAAGLLGSVLAAFLAQAWFYRALPARHAVAVGLLVGVAGILGDLAESVLKRAAGAKDSSGLLPGHGGVLDRADSLLFAAPVLYYYYRAFLDGIR